MQISDADSPWILAFAEVTEYRHDSLVIPVKTGIQ